VDRGLAAIQVLDEGTDATLVLEHVALLVALVDQFDPDSRIQEREFA